MRHSLGRMMRRRWKQEEEDEKEDEEDEEKEDGEEELEYTERGRTEELGCAAKDTTSTSNIVERVSTCVSHIHCTPN